jgi:flagellar motor switch protein FliN/FliY
MKKNQNQEILEDNKENTKENLRAVYDIPVVITVVLGSAQMNISQLLKLAKGSVVELDRNVGEQLDLLVNGKKVAKGEVVIVEDRIGITLTEIIRDNI